ncbi:hypothetical protein D3C76_1330510 [compost metagenome]
MEAAVEIPEGDEGADTAHKERNQEGIAGADVHNNRVGSQNPDGGERLPHSHYKRILHQLKQLHVKMHYQREEIQQSANKHHAKGDKQKRKPVQSIGLGGIKADADNQQHADNQKHKPAQHGLFVVFFIAAEIGFEQRNIRIPHHPLAGYAIHGDCGRDQCKRTQNCDDP